MEEHHEATCRVVASIEGGGEAYVDQCRRLKASNDPEVLESICDTMAFHVTKPCYIAALASDREKAFEASDLNSLKRLGAECDSFVQSYQQSRSDYFQEQAAPVDNLTTQFARAKLSPVAGVQKKVPRSRQVTPQSSKAPSVTDGDIPAQAARIVSLQRVSELEAELALKANRVIELESELEYNDLDGHTSEEVLEGFYKAQGLQSRVEGQVAAIADLTKQVASKDARIAELEAAHLNPAATASTSRKGSKKQLESELERVSKQLELFQKQNAALIRESTVTICDIEDLEAILDAPLNNAGYDWSLSEYSESETLAKVYIYAVETDADADADADADDATVAKEGAKKAKNNPFGVSHKKLEKASQRVSGGLAPGMQRNMSSVLGNNVTAQDVLSNVQLGNNS
ncbi:hypothetical protein CYMTET_15654 [Cymbomonas tetramitiformis]|uniref:Uncharacterized protein n=1 Tax=Cymbomonas tetramitiformis TaxID=36881 RepID=A0AAE0C4G1_9CHLO|nr:hypothetical protein CYMTET_43322 [Cymbomonas tetramitiformis]KAK3276260.1 hypothetical protein CYMTET_15654 [Cymbomonas tetramitiformis]